ncbi:helix-turn-helix domain-containing protein [Clostridium taeniosporum]|uniref:AraC family transcriptional regulator n=1 Tax=Clostridium taeniosporum TaxID=394958 RepID=A0A1D7XP38_9CLOT|nr:AraC family transcriptional regulator [Clostridium taeniosporum]AOR25074.1 AraC family transcriptional regulator [Clostridium taeniosporum]
MQGIDIVRDHEFLNRVSSVEKLDNDDYRTIYKMNCNEGLGLMTVYKIFTGIELVYNEFEAATCLCDLPMYDNIIEINHCKEGREECILLDGSFLYMGEGDLSINMMSNHADTIGFPLKHYKGISVMIYMDEIVNEVPEILKDVNIDIYNLKEKFCSNDKCFIMRAKDKIEHIFSELYSVPESVQKAYFKLKVLELLVFLSIIDPSEEEEKEYYSKDQVERIKEIKKFITENLQHRYTIEELAKMYCISPTTLKTYFKGVYGTSIASYIKEYRIKNAAISLRQTKNSIADVALSVGYESQSKFAAVFKKIMGISPLEYRKKCLEDILLQH